MTFPLKSLVEAASKAPIVPVLVVDRIEMALVIEFKSVADIRKAMSDGVCKFTSFDCRWKVNKEN